MRHSPLSGDLMFKRFGHWYMNLTGWKKWTARVVIIALAIAPFFNWSRILGSKTQQPPVTSAPPTTNTPGPLTGPQPSNNSTTVTATQSQQKLAPHTVARGEYIVSIAASLGVPWESIVLANEATLKNNTEKYCAGKSERYKNRSSRRGHFCNYRIVDKDGKPLVFANTLMPGDVLMIPSTSAPAQIQQAIANVKGNQIVVVIDDTGSMTDDRERVAAWYMQAVRNSGKQITKVILYADGYVRELEAGEVTFRTTGNFENTRSALERAATYRPDAIVLVSDEPGDDWKGFIGMKLPPVIAHSLDPCADANLASVAHMTGGRLFTSHVGPMGLASLH